MPVVLAQSIDPVGAGVVASLARPGGNVTGFMQLVFGPDLTGRYRRAAGYVDRILKGEKAGRPPVHQTTKIGFAINLKTAKVLGLEVPPLLQQRADEVIE